jgi:hypothetical protein
MMRRKNLKEVAGTALAGHAKTASILCAFAVSAFLSVTVLLSRATAQQDQSSVPNMLIEGDWVRTDQNGSGDFGGLNANVAKAQLTAAGEAIAARSGRGRGRGPAAPAATPAPNAKETPHAAGQAYVLVSMPCNGMPGNGLGSFNPDSGGFHIIVGKDQVVWAQERGGSRIIYIDGRPHPDIATASRPVYNSIGHFENGVLVVDTVGLPTGGGIPGGGVRGPDTHLSERFEVSPDGQHMSIVYTYSDPNLYVAPHSYTYTFDRATPAPTYAFEEWCDASDPIESQSIVPPPQQ